MLDKILSNVGIFCFLSLFSIILMWSEMNHVEGNALPVVSDVEIISTQETPEGLLVWVNFDKDRPCEFKDLHWFWKNSPRPVEFLTDVTGKTISRPEGAHDAGPWLLHGMTEQMFEESISYASHECHFLWDTKTEFYRGPKHERIR